MTVTSLKKLDARILRETHLKALARVVGYSDKGEPIEIVYSGLRDCYEWHVGGYYNEQDVSDDMLTLLIINPMRYIE